VCHLISNLGSNVKCYITAGKSGEIKNLIWVDFAKR
jgi:hypothetical protein